MRAARLFYVVGLVTLGCARSQSSRMVSTAALDGPERPAGPLELSLPVYPKGPAFDLVSVRGQVVLLDVWATWCEPCKDSLPIYEKLAGEFQSQGLKVYAINIDGDLKQIDAFLQETRLTIPILLDQDAQVASSVLNVQMMPTSFLLDRKGQVRHVHEGVSGDSLEKTRAEIAALLAEKP